jgi:hypothetical protein
MADENKDRSKPIASGIEPGPTEHLSGETSQSTASLLSAGSPAVTTTGTATGGESLRAGRTGGTGTSQQGRDSFKGSTADMASTAKQYAGDMASRAKEKGRTMFEQQKDSALGQVGSVADAIRNTANNLQGEGQDQTARYVQMIADQLESLGGRLREKDLDTLVRDAEGFARRSPGTFLAGSVVAGFLLARFLKSSSDRQVGRPDWEEQARRTVAAGEAGPYSSASASPVGADGTPATGASTATAAGLTGSNLGGGSRP